MNVTIGVPYYDSVTPEMFYATLCAVMSSKHHLHISMAGGPQISQNREAILTEALAAKSDRLVFIDTDINFGPDALERLLAHPYPIVGGMYHIKQIPLTSAVLLPGNDGAGFFTGRLTMPDHPIKAAILPAGFLSLDLAALAPLPRPWFYNAITESGDIVTEDVMFCRNALAAGFELWCDPTIPLRHMGRYGY